VLCLTYRQERHCAIAKNVSDAKAIAASLKVIFPDKRTYLLQKAQMQKLISAGAITLDGAVFEERVGQFETQKVTYRLDYSNLTVQQLLAAGISPDDPSVSSAAGQQVSFWIDKKTGLIVKSKAMPASNPEKELYAMEYTRAEVGEASVPAKPGEIVGTDYFVRFYHASEDDYRSDENCSAQQGSERDFCYRTLAAERDDWQTCEKVKDAAVRESCVLVVAQNTKNKSLCGKLDGLADDCYISIAGMTGEYDLCKLLKNASLVPQCTAAATEGAKAAAAEAERQRRLMESRECVVDSDCRTAGNAGQYCVANNSTKTFPVEDTPMLACFKNLPCGCNDGFCGFRKNESYYACINDAEELLLKAFISSLNATNSSSNAPSNATSNAG